MTRSRRNLPLLLLSVREAAMAYFRPTLQHFGVTDQQWRILRALSQEGPMEIGVVASRCELLSPSLTGILTRMDKMGLLRREVLRDDQRRTQVSLTPKGAALVERAAPLLEAQYQRIERQLGPGGLGRLYAQLDLALDALRPTGEDAAPAVTAPRPRRRSAAPRRPAP
jgi:homoprotocatechuate degradation regulator HpaR